MTDSGYVRHRWGRNTDLGGKSRLSVNSIALSSGSLGGGLTSRVLKTNISTLIFQSEVGGTIPNDLSRLLISCLISQLISRYLLIKPSGGADHLGLTEI